MEITPKRSVPLAVTYPGASYWAFGDSPQMADELSALVVGGIKTATCCSLQAYQQGATALRLLRFCDVTAEMAANLLG